MREQTSQALALDERQQRRTAARGLLPCLRLRARPRHWRRCPRSAREAIGLGGIQLLAALSIWRGGAFGRWFGIFAAGVAVIGAMMMIPAYPFWALTLVALDVLVIYGLAAYGGKPGLLE